LAYLKQEIVASQQTDADALQAATNFAGDGRDQKSFDAAFEKTLRPKGLNKGIAANIKRNDAIVQGLGLSRNFVRNIYTAKQAETLKPERVGDNYVVAIVTEVLKEGTMPLAKARPLHETSFSATGKKRKPETKSRQDHFTGSSGCCLG
jgi:peptidyl-prolyl cis-trans isomerase D